MPTPIVFLPDAGPENPFQYQLIAYLKQNGYDVIIGKKYKLGSTYKAIKTHQPRIIYYDWVHSYIIGKTWWWSLLKSLVFVLELLYACSVKRIKLVHTLHNLQNHAGKWLKLERVVYGLFLRRCTHIRVYSESVKEAAIKKFGLDPKKIIVAQDLPYHFYYPNQITRAEARLQLGFDAKTFIYLFLGEIKPYKGLQNLIKTYEDVATESDMLIIAGRAPDKSYLLSLTDIAPNSSTIKWYHHFIKDEQLQVFFNAADVVVLPFTRIDHSGSIDLAMSFKKPIITLKTPAIEKLLNHQKELLFDTPTDLGIYLKKVKNADLEQIGIRNYQVADATNYPDILKLFV